MKFTIWNYRNIPYNSPLTFELKEGITFILGQNNYGKSNLIKFFYDLRSVILAGNKDILKGNYNAKLESYFDHVKNRHLGGDQIKFTIENEMGRKAIFHVQPTAAGHEHTYDVTINCDYTAGTQDNGSVDKFVDQIREFGTNSFFVGTARTLSWKTFSRSLDLDTGSTFFTNYSKWADGAEIGTIKKMRRFKEEIRLLFNFREFDIRLNDQKNEMLVTINKEEFFLSELGTGVLEFIILLSNALIKGPSYIFIDEPESGLHPKMQEALIRALAAKAKRSLFATSHSIALARSSADYIYSLTNTPEKTPILKKFGQHYTPTIAQELNEMSFSQYVEMGGDNILLVEGRTDIKAFREILRKYGIDSYFIILSLGVGQFIARDKSKITDELQEITRLHAHSVSVIFDSERSEENELLRPDLQSFQDICETLKFNAFSTDFHSTENYITQAAITKVVGKEYKALGPFEKFGQNSNKWEKEKNWLMFIEMEKENFKNTQLHNFIEQILIPLTKDGRR